MGIFSKRKNDWLIIHSMRGTWDITNKNKVITGHQYCNYEIMFSPSRDEIKIEMSGSDPKTHSLYNFMMSILTSYKQALLSDGDFVELKKENDKKILEIE